jgi:ribonuclease-3
VNPDLDELQKKINVFFREPRLLETALTHPSYMVEHAEVEHHNQRLEFLGDAILGSVVAYYLYEHFPKFGEGHLTKTRAAVVCEPSLAAVARKLELGKYLRLGKGEENSGGRKRPSILADAFEALTAAVFLDQGWEATCDFLAGLLKEEIEKNVHGVTRDYKTHLQELVQSRGNESPYYQILEESGPDHDKKFTSGVFLKDKLLGKGTGKSKKESEQNAARAALEYLRKTSGFFGK